LRTFGCYSPLGLLHLKLVIVADAMRCRKETAELIVEKKASYLLSAKDNQPTLKKDIEKYVGDDVLRKPWTSSKRSRKTAAGWRPARFITHEVG